jgi:thiazole synthase
MEEALLASGSELVTVALKRVDVKNNEQDDLLIRLKYPHINLLAQYIRCTKCKRSSFRGSTGKGSIRNQLDKTGDTS